MDSPSTGTRCWTPEQEKAFERMWLTEPEDEVARKLGRTVKSCRARAISLVIRRRDAILSPSIVAAELDVHPNTVLNWCRQGLLPATRSRILRNRMGRVWEVDPVAYAVLKELWLATPMPHRCMKAVFPRFHATLQNLHSREA